MQSIGKVATNGRKMRYISWIRSLQICLSFVANITTISAERSWASAAWWGGKWVRLVQIKIRSAGTATLTTGPPYDQLLHTTTNQLREWHDDDADRLWIGPP